MVVAVKAAAAAVDDSNLGSRFYLVSLFTLSRFADMLSSQSFVV